MATRPPSNGGSHCESASGRSVFGPSQVCKLPRTEFTHSLTSAREPPCSNPIEPKDRESLPRPRRPRPEECACLGPRTETVRNKPTSGDPLHGLSGGRSTSHCDWPSRCPSHRYHGTAVGQC